MYKVIKTGSKGNAVFYHDCILLDCGVSFKDINPIINDIQLILLTHEHADHINISTLKRIKDDRPTVRIGCCEWMLKYLKGYRFVDCFEIGKTYNYGTFNISPIKLYHDVENCGYRIITDDYKIIHATDTAHMEGIEANNYDLYSIEHNYDEELAEKAIAAARLKGDFCHISGSINSHLSIQQATEWIYRNKKESSEVLRLHESNNY